MRVRRLSGWMAVLTVAGAVSVLAAAEDPASLVKAQLADLLYGDGRFRDAIDAYDAAYAAASGPLRVAMGRGLVKSLLRSGEFRRARTTAAELADTAPDDAEVLALLGDTRWSAGQFAAAEQAYAAALAADADQARAISGMARALDSRGRPDEALEHARRAVGLAPREPEFHHTLGFVLERQRRYPEAALAYTNYSNLLPNKDNSEMAAWARQQVRFLKSFDDRVPLAARGDADQKVHTVPFRLRKDKIVVTAKVNGRAEMDFILDTGAEMTVVSRRVAQRYGVQPVVYTLSAGVGGVGLRGLMVGTMDRLQIGSLVIDQVPTLIKNPPLQGLPTQEVESFSPLAMGFSVRIDYRRRLLTMARVLPEAAADFVLPMRLHRLATVTGSVNGKTSVPFVIDTGGEVLSISRSTADAIAVVPPRHIGLKVYGTSGWDPDAFLLTGIHVAFDRVALDNVAVPVLNLEAPSILLGYDLGGIVGHRFLSKYDVTIDLRRSEVRLATSAN